MKFPVLSPELLAQARAGSRAIRESGILDLAPKLFEQARQGLLDAEAAGILPRTRPQAMENTEIPAEDDQVRRLRSRIHGRVPPKEEQRMVDIAKKIIECRDEWVLTTDLKSLGLSKKTVWQVFGRPEHRDHVIRSRPFKFLRTELLKYMVEEYWPRGCPLASGQKGRSPQTK
jgi:hypothetical protein